MESEVFSMKSEVFVEGTDYRTESQAIISETRLGNSEVPHWVTLYHVNYDPFKSHLIPIHNLPVTLIIPPPPPTSGMS